MPPSSRTFLVAVALLVGVVSCGDAADDRGITVMATTTIIGDIAVNVVGADGAVEVLVPVGADPHEYQASAQQVAAMLSADLIVTNGLGLEAGLSDVLNAARQDGARIVVVGDEVDPLTFGASDDFDPHFWFDPTRVAAAAQLIASELAEVDLSIDWSSRADVYAAALAEVDAEIEALVAAVPEAKRLLVTNHDSLGYFAARYGFEIVGTVVPGGSALAEPSSAALADLVAAIERTGVPAIFAETTEPVMLAEAVAAEAAGDVAVVELFTGSLGEAGSDADTLIGLLRDTASRIAAALTGSVP